MSNAISEQEILDAWGQSPDVVSAELERFSETARVLSSHHERLIDKHPQQWVGVYDGKVEVFGKTIKSVMSQLDEKGYPKGQTIIRYIDREDTNLIL